MNTLKKYLCLTAICVCLAVAKHPTDEDKTFQQICQENGFKSESYSVTTSDGYILTLWRIPGPLGENTTQGKPPVLMQHGVLDSGNTWVMNYGEVAPAFVAARAGYDIWIGNSRGNTYSLLHTTLDPKKDAKDYYNFDWTDMGAKDLPPVLDKIEQITGINKVAYIGHSMGSTQMFYALANKIPNIAERLSVFIALAPVTKITHTWSKALILLSNNYELIDAQARLVGMYNFLPRDFINNEVTKLFCNVIPSFCEAIESLFATSDPEADDTERFQVYMAHSPNGCSLKSLMLYAQNRIVDRFQIWGDNFKWLHPEKTELIPIEKIKLPTAMFVGENDELGTLTDAQWAQKQMGDSVVHFSTIKGGHLSFLIGKDMTYFSKDVINVLKQYQPLPLDELIFLQ